jgi:hypothetical protein
MSAPMSTLAVGSARYGLLLNENGVIVDDGIVARLSDNHFWVNTTSGGAERVAMAFEEWLQRGVRAAPGAGRRSERPTGQRRGQRPRAAENCLWPAARVRAPGLSPGVHEARRWLS